MNKRIEEVNMETEEVDADERYFEYKRICNWKYFRTFGLLLKTNFTPINTSRHALRIGNNAILKKPGFFPTRIVNGKLI